MIGASDKVTRTVVLGLVSFLAPAQASMSGSKSCACLGSLPRVTDIDCTYSWAYRGKCVETVGLKSSFTTYPADYGESCKIHKEPGQSACFDLTQNPPVERPKSEQGDFCSQPWCYVDPCNCDKKDVTKSDYFPETLQYSYSTCGGENTYTALVNSINVVGNAKCVKPSADHDECAATCPAAFNVIEMCSNKASAKSCFSTSKCKSWLVDNGGTQHVDVKCKMADEACYEKQADLFACLQGANLFTSTHLNECLEAVKTRKLADHKEKCCSLLKTQIDCSGQKCISLSLAHDKLRADLAIPGFVKKSILDDYATFSEYNVCPGINLPTSDEEVQAIIDEAVLTSYKKAAVANFAAPAQSAPVLAMVAAITMSFFY